MKESISKTNDIIEKHYRDIYKYCLAKLRGDEAAAADAAGDVIAAAQRSAEKLAAHPDPKGWLYKAARYCVKNVKRQQKRYRRRFVSFDPARLDPDPIESVLSRGRKRPAAEWEVYEDPPEGSELSDEDIEAIKESLLDSLEPGERDLIISRYEKGESLDELAERYGVSKDAVRMRIKRASVKLEELVKIYFENYRSF